MWSYIIDGALILILLICTIVGIVKGFFDSLLSLIGTGLALVISVFTAKYISNFINKIFNFEDMILKTLDKSNEGAIKFFGGKFSLDNVEAAKFCVWICSVVIMFILIKLAIFILAKIFASVTKTSPTISGINRVLGMVFGIAKGGVIVISALALCSVIAQVPVIGTPVYEKINETAITSSIYKFVDEFVEDNFTEDKVKDIIDRIISDNTSSDNTSGSNTNDSNSDNKITAN